MTFIVFLILLVGEIINKGTTGNPKGVILSHENMMSSLRGTMTLLGTSSDDCHISYLPLAHIFER